MDALWVATDVGWADTSILPLPPSPSSPQCSPDDGHTAQARASAMSVLRPLGGMRVYVCVCVCVWRKVSVNMLLSCLTKEALHYRALGYYVTPKR